MIHELKIKPEYFTAVVSGDKTFEIRNNADRNFQVGDTLLLWEWDEGFTSQTAERTVSYITDFEQKPGYVVLGLVNHREHELLEKFHRTGVAIERAISTGSVLADHPFKSRLELLANHHEREMELAAQLSDATRQCGVMAELLREAKDSVYFHLESPDSRLSGEEAGKLIALTESIADALAGKLPDPAVTVTETIRTAPERIWLQVGDQEHYRSEPFPRDTSEVSWCADSVVGCEVPYVRADLAGKLLEPAMPEGWKLVEKANCFTLVSDGQVIASMAGTTAEGTAAILAAVLSGKVPERRITKPARVWGARFMPGVAEQTVIEAAYRYAEHDASQEEKQAGKINFDLLMAAVHKTVPEGWQLVPVEPTQEMVAVGCEDEGSRITDGAEFARALYADMLAAAPKPAPTKGRTITEGQEFELTTVLQAIASGFSDDPSHDAAALLKRITGEVPWTGDSFLIPPRQGGEPCVSASPSSSPD